MLKVNGTIVPEPSSLKWTLQDLSSEDSGRALNGTMYKDRVAQKRKLDCEWPPMRWSHISTLLKAVNQSVMFQLTYPDAMSGQYETRTFYVGDRTAPAKILIDGKELWDNTSFSFIEQ